MNNSLRSPTNARIRQLVRVLSVALLVVVVCASGCSAKKYKNTISGKVSVGGKPAMGELVFVGPDGKTQNFGINSDGTYRAAGLSAGKYKIGIQMPGGAAPPQGGGLIAPKDAAAQKGSDLLGGSTAVPPPAGYKDPNTSGLEYEVVSGEQTKDFELDPNKK